MRPLSLPSLSASPFFLDGSPLLIYMESLKHVRWLRYVEPLLCSLNCERRKRTGPTGTSKFSSPASRRVAETLSDAGLQVDLEVGGRWKDEFIASIRFCFHQSLQIYHRVVMYTSWHTFSTSPSLHCTIRIPISRKPELARKEWYLQSSIVDYICSSMHFYVALFIDITLGSAHLTA